MKNDPMIRWFKEPLLHFLLAGGLLFAAYVWINEGREDEPQVVRISTEQVNWLKETWNRRWSRQPDEQELRGLVAGYLKEALLAREARELGLEQDDTVVRRRLAQKMEFLVKDAASLAEPDEAELRGFYEQHQDRFRSPARVSFQQVYFRDEAGARQGLEALEAGNTADLGDSSLLARAHIQVDELAVTNVFGPGFFDAVVALESAQWHGPVASTYGYHLVRISEHQSARVLPFGEVQSKVLAEWEHTKQEKAQQQYLVGLLEKYQVVVDEEVAAVLGPLDRVMR